MLRVNSADWKIKFSLLSICEGNCVNNSKCAETDEKANRRFAPFPVASDGLGTEIFNYENGISAKANEFRFLRLSGHVRLRFTGKQTIDCETSHI